MMELIVLGIVWIVCGMLTLSITFAFVAEFRDEHAGKWFCVMMLWPLLLVVIGAACAIDLVRNLCGRRGRK